MGWKNWFENYRLYSSTFQIQGKYRSFRSLTMILPKTPRYHFGLRF
jgi:hypothetical protein